VSYPGTITVVRFYGREQCLSNQRRRRPFFAVSFWRASFSNKLVDSAKTSPQLTILTIGHSTRTLEDFLTILKAHHVAQLVDVRTVPKSRRVPHFNIESLAGELPAQDIDYVHLKSLGGLRHARKDSVNTGWRNASFRGYADYMSTPEFQRGIDQLLDLSRQKRTVIMCAEAVPWRCHRSLIGDALLVRGVQVEDILTATTSREHSLTPFAKVNGLQITYPAEGNLELFRK
jgi:uncharacterized protein (DUF488 family)